HGITEIAIVLHDGERIVDEYETLINPNQPIPYFIQVLTGITNEMTADAPQFEAVADEIYSRLKDAVFVAHNVNFDYSFVKHHLAKEGFDLHSNKLCTVRLARKIIPGLPSYSLGKLCRQLNIENQNRHRAMGDAYATSQLFNLLLSKDNENHVAKSLGKKTKEQSTPPNLSSDKLLDLPSKPGVYYFYNQQGKVIYVGKAKNLKKRVNSHFANNSTRRQKQDFLQNIHNITYETCGTELMAILLESAEIKRLWPDYNRSQKNYEPVYGIYDYSDQHGYVRLGVDKLKKNIQPLLTFRLYSDAIAYLHKAVSEFELCPRLCGVQNTRNKCVGLETQMCRGACEQSEATDDYNTRVQLFIDELQEVKPTYIVKETGRTADEQSYLLIENGKFFGMGYVAADTLITSIDELKNHLKPLKENSYMNQVIRNYAERNPHKIVRYENENLQVW
ncbi:MAG: exonuclease domain-containing protein, partial [Bacteroidia bacterium]